MLYWFYSLLFPMFYLYFDAVSEMRIDRLFCSQLSCLSPPSNHCRTFFDGCSMFLRCYSIEE